MCQQIYQKDREQEDGCIFKTLPTVLFFIFINLFYKKTNPFPLNWLSLRRVQKVMIYAMWEIL